MPETPAPLTFCCLLWAHPDRVVDLHEYEDAVLALLPEHGARVIERVRGDGSGDHPVEVQVLRFPDSVSLEAYMTDPRRTALLAERDRVVARTELFPVRRPDAEDLG